VKQSAEEKQSYILDASTLRDYRKSLRESQSSFWSRFGVTQSRGSRFEMGAEVPSPVAILLSLYIDGTITDMDLCKVRGTKTDCEKGCVTS
jgi:DNA-binding transcriptional regulator YiaG